MEVVYRIDDLKQSSTWFMRHLHNNDKGSMFLFDNVNRHVSNVYNLRQAQACAKLTVLCLHVFINTSRSKFTGHTHIQS